MPSKRQKPIAGLREQSLAYQAEAEARKMSRELHGSEGLWELYLTDAYRRCAGLIPDMYKDDHDNEDIAEPARRATP